LATEAFDMAGDPAAFPEQVAGPTKRLEPFFENLRPWQPKKIYYFQMPTAKIFSAGKDLTIGEGDLQVEQTSILANGAGFVPLHQSQAKSFWIKVAQMDEAQIEKMATSDSFWTEALHFVLGKSLVGGSVTGDIFDGITPGAIPFARPEVSPEPAPLELSVELAVRTVSTRNFGGLTAYESPASRAAGNCSARPHHASDSIVGAQPKGEVAGNFAGGLPACRMDGSRAAQESSPWRRNRWPPRGSKCCCRRSPKTNEEAGAARNQRSCEFERANHRGDKTSAWNCGSERCPNRKLRRLFLTRGFHPFPSRFRQQEQIIELAGPAQPLRAVDHHAFAIDNSAMSLRRNAARLQAPRAFRSAYRMLVLGMFFELLRRASAATTLPPLGTAPARWRSAGCDTSPFHGQRSGHR